MQKPSVIDDPMLYCLVERCRFNDKEGACRAEDAVMIELGLDGRPGCESFEPDPCWIGSVPAIKC